MKISLYVSDHGYGHATRSIALARALAAEGGPGIRIEILNHHAHGLVTRALAGLPQIKVIDRPTDVGFVCRDDRLMLDRGPTALRVSVWISGWKQFVADEVARLRTEPPDLIVTDVAPEALLVAERLGIASVVTSNFTWVDQYEAHLRPDLVAPLRGAYALAHCAHAYPMRTAMSGVRNIVPAGLVTRAPLRERADVRHDLGVDDDEPMVHLGFGWSADAVALAGEIDAGYLPAGVRLLLSSNLARLAPFQNPSNRVVQIPEGDCDAHEAIGACDLVVTKAGYGTVAEAIAAKVPLLTIPVEGSRESTLIASTVEKLGIGRSAPAGEELDGGLFATAADMLDNLTPYRCAYERLPSEFGPGAAQRLARILLKGPEEPGL